MVFGLCHDRDDFAITGDLVYKATMKKYLLLLRESQGLFQFSSKAQISKLLLGHIIVGLLEAFGFVPLFLLISVIANPNSILHNPTIAALFGL